MMTPDSRPIGVLTPAILATASHWCIYRKGIADIRPASTLVLRVSDLDDDLPLLTCGGDCYWNDDSGWMCYPCTLQPNGLVAPEPWPVLDGEEEIEEWRGHSHERLEPARIKAYWKGGTGWMWQLESKRKHRPVSELQRIDERPNMHPAPRKGGKWVWEADK